MYFDGRDAMPRVSISRVENGFLENGFLENGNGLETRGIASLQKKEFLAWRMEMG